MDTYFKWYTMSEEREVSFAAMKLSGKQFNIGLTLKLSVSKEESILFALGVTWKLNWNKSTSHPSITQGC